MHKTTLALALILPLAATAGQGTPGAHFLENWDLDGNGEVSLQEAQEKRGDVFYTFDSDDDGFLDAAEYAMFDEARALDMEASGGGHGKGPGKRLQTGMTLDFNDTDGDGRVSRAEFTGQAEAWITLIDRDGNGAVTSGDFGPRG